MNTLATASADSAGNLWQGALAFVAIFLAYWLPTIIALLRRVPAMGQVVVVNLFLGWTVLGWIIALVMAFRAVPQAPVPTSPPAATPPGAGMAP